MRYLHLLIAAVFVFLMMGYQTAPPTIDTLPSQYATLNDSVRIHYKVLEPSKNANGAARDVQREVKEFCIREEPKEK